MKITNPQNISVSGYPVLELTIDGTRHRFSAEDQKPTLVRHGLVALDGHSSTLPNGLEVEATDNPELFQVVTAFGISVFNGTWDVDTLSAYSPSDVQALGKRLEGFAMEGSPPWSQIASAL